MILKQLKPTTPGQRQRVYVDKKTLDDPTYNKRLFKPLRKKGGRNHHGRLTSFRKGGGHKRRYRLIDFKREAQGGIVQTIEHDPNRSAFISLVQGSDGKAFYILTPEGLNRGDQVESGDHVDIKTGNCLPLGNMPVGTVVHNVEQRPGAGGTLIRAAGSFGELIQKGEQRCRLRLSSGEHIMVLSSCKGTVGVVSNAAHQNEKIAKAGRSRWLGRRPSVRGVAMNPVDHPLGGGAAKSSGGRPSVSPWGKAKGRKTRSVGRSNRFIVQRRKKR